MTKALFTTVPDTDAYLNRCISRFSDQPEHQALFQLDYTLTAEWLPTAPELRLQGIYLLTKQPVTPCHTRSVTGVASRNSDSVRIQGSVCESGQWTHSWTRSWTRSDSRPARALQNFAREHRLPIIDFCNPFLLDPVTVEKPWGQEIWFSGMEERGTTCITDGIECSPMPWLLSLAPARLCAQKAITLMKILAPVADDPLGNLYFEVHRTKQETYVVTGIESVAHTRDSDEKQTLPAAGYIRLGMNPEHRKRFENDEEFLAAYQAAVAEYRVVRTEIDAILNGEKRRNGYAPNEVIQPQLQRQWLNQLDPLLHQKEVRARELMNQFTQRFQLHLGDLVEVPAGLPHALQHGVKVLEFQTPVYERCVISFEQQTLTQAHWDTESVLTRLSLEDAKDRIHPEKELVNKSVVARFDNTSLYCIRLKPGATFRISPADYGVGYILAGEFQLQNQALLSQGTGFLLSRCLLATGCELTAHGSLPSLCYLALENMHS